MIDIAQQISAISRQVAADTQTATVTLQRRYAAAVEDVWDAITDPDRVRRWFLPLSGELRPGGSFQLEGHVGGEIISCEPPGHLAVTFGGETSLVDVRLSADGEQTLLILEHSVPLSLAGSAAGALYVGPGWDGALMGVALYLDGQVAEDPVAAANSPEAQQFCVESIDVWTAAVEATGSAEAEAIAAGRQAALAQYAPDLVS
jgi:uncharacterized protein YndB with AHSA1/START domain